MVSMNIESAYELRSKFFEFIGYCFQTLARPFGFPRVRGMTLVPYNEESYFWSRKETPFDNLPIRRIQFPPFTRPENYPEVIFGGLPKPAISLRTYYHNAHDGFYSYFMQGYKNLNFLPDWFSEFLQVKCHICTDFSILELSREAIFAILVIYYYACVVRVTIGWYVSINPYVFPLNYLTMAVDWADEVATSLMPVLGGYGIGTPLLFLGIGKFGDYLNNLVFTMPYLPSEGQYEKSFLDGEVKDILVFRDLPYLWYKYPIPNDIREFWFTERRDILRYMQKAYGKLNIQILPDRKIDSLSFITNLKEQSILENHTLIQNNLENISSIDFNNLVSHITNSFEHLSSFNTFC